VEEESREFAVRQEQLRAAGRIAAEVAHQLKNPLGIINTAAFNLQRALPQAKDSVHQQIQIIREEVERSDQILTELMGYAQLAEGKVERLEVLAELERALQQVFPPAVQYAVDIQRDYEPDVPALLMQRGHLAGIFVNLLLNAREAMEGGGQLKLSVRKDGDHAVVVAIRDNGPGIAAEHLEKIFEPHYTTKPRGTGLGLAIVRHNLDMYGGTVRVESELGKGARFLLHLPARTLTKAI
jgi:two-component system sensor histidine kinase HydH